MPVADPSETIIGSYRIVAPLGKGGMARVFIGEHRMLGHRVAIKVLREEYLASPSMRRRFLNEARAAAKIRHPSIIELYDFGELSGNAYIVMELLEGENLRQRLKRGPMPQDQIATFGRQISAALSVAHACGVIHRDIKPDNIFIVPDPEEQLGERAKVLDFGIAKVLSGPDAGVEQTATGILVGTPAYMSPEQCRGLGGADARSDIYSLGVVVYRMATGRLPFTAKGAGELIAQHLYETPQPPIELRPELSSELNATILRCLAKDPADRYDSVSVLADAFAMIGGGRIGSATPVIGAFTTANTAAARDVIALDEEDLVPETLETPVAHHRPPMAATAAPRTPEPKCEEEDTPTTFASSEQLGIPAPDVVVPTEPRRLRWGLLLGAGAVLVAAAIAALLSSGSSESRHPEVARPATTATPATTTSTVSRDAGLARMDAAAAPVAVRAPPSAPPADAAPAQAHDPDMQISNAQLVDRCRANKPTKQPALVACTLAACAEGVAPLARRYARRVRSPKQRRSLEVRCRKDGVRLRPRRRPRVTTPVDTTSPLVPADQLAPQ